MKTMAEQTATNVPLLETDLIRSFVAISETGSFTRAAQRVYRTPSAVSMQIKRLEETLGRTLFLREGRTVSLTPDGEALLGFARRMLRLNEEAVSRFLCPSVAGTISFGAPDDFGTRFLPNILARFACTHPLVEVNVVLGTSVELLERIEAGTLDIALVTSGNAGQRDTDGTIVFSEPLVWAGLKGGIAHEHTPLPLALSGRTCAWRAAALAALDKAGLPYRIAYTSEHCVGQAAALHADLAIAPFPASLANGPLVALGEADGLPDLGNYHILLHRGANGGAAVDALEREVVESFAAEGGPARLGRARQVA